MNVNNLNKNQIEVHQGSYSFFQDILTVDEFIKAHNHVFYCECFILDDGRVVLAQPSHQIMLFALVAYYDPTIKTWDDIDVGYYIEEMYAITASVEVRYSAQTGLYPQMTELQEQSFKKMVAANLIEDNYLPINPEGYLNMISKGLLKDKRRYKWKQIN